MNRSRSLGIILLVVFTSFLTFAASVFIFYGIGYFNPKYEISFDNKVVKGENIKKFNDVRNILKKWYYEGADDNTLLEGAVAGMAESLKDPYTVYFNKDQMKAFSERTEGSYVGIGVNINMDNNGILTIIEPFEGSPAQKAGLKQGDKIIRVDGKDVTNIKDEEAIIKMIKGKEGTIVKITAYRPDENRSIDFDMPRKKIKINNIKSEVLPNNIGYMKIVMFDAEVEKDFKVQLDKLLEKKVKGLIIDVRDNPGGSYEGVVTIVDRLIPEGTIVYTEDKNKTKNVEKSDKTELDLPMAILVNGNSASASEILAGAIKDNNKGTLIGTKTFGKGLVQTVLTLEDGSGLKVTIARYFTPSGVCIQGIGIEPDIETQNNEKYNNIPVSQIPREDDLQFKKAVEVVEKEIK